MRFLFLLLLLFGCSAKKLESVGSSDSLLMESIATVDSSGGARVIQESATSPVDNISTDAHGSLAALHSPCELSKHIRDNDVVKAVLDSALILFKKEGDDGCILALLDSIALIYIQTSDDLYIRTLERICSVSDGYLSEYYLELSEDIFFRNFGNYIGFLHNNKSACMRTTLVEALGARVGMSEDRKKKRLEIEQFVADKIQTLRFSDEQVQFVNGIMADINENVLD